MNLKRGQLTRVFIHTSSLLGKPKSVNFGMKDSYLGDIGPSTADNRKRQQLRCRRRPVDYVFLGSDRTAAINQFVIMYEDRVPVT